MNNFIWGNSSFLVAFVIIYGTLGVFIGMGVYTMILLVKALKIYIKKNS